ncbi:MAG: cupredoxin domain-containing protein [Anaerolineales bacterium]|nr:cupredoxin domain-containing protein [Anaerolineales bacterium]
MQTYRLLRVALAVAGLLGACSGAAPTAAPLAVTVQAFQMTYQPPTLELQAGQPVKLTLQNDDVVDHDFSIQTIPLEMMSATPEPMAGHDMTHVADQPELHVSALSNTAGTVEFTPTTPGTYVYFCTVAGHQAAGMQGTLVVTAP